MVRHSLELLRKEQESADKILSVTQQREKENYELPVAVTKDQLTKARVVQRILQLEGRQDELEVTLRGQTGMAENTQIEITPEDLPGVAEQEGANLVAAALQDNIDLRPRRLHGFIFTDQRIFHADVLSESKKDNQQHNCDDDDDHDQRLAHKILLKTSPELLRGDSLTRIQHLINRGGYMLHCRQVSRKNIRCIELFSVRLAFSHIQYLQDTRSVKPEFICQFLHRLSLSGRSIVPHDDKRMAEESSERRDRS